jgi:hypothetical protein
MDRKRFPAPELISTELETAGFFAVRSTPPEERKVYKREGAHQTLRGRFASRFALISYERYRTGPDRAERELPDKVESAIEIAMLSARR